MNPAKGPAEAVIEAAPPNIGPEEVIPNARCEDRGVAWLNENGASNWVGALDGGVLMAVDISFLALKIGCQGQQ